MPGNLAGPGRCLGFCGIAIAIGSSVGTYLEFHWTRQALMSFGHDLGTWRGDVGRGIGVYIRLSLAVDGELFQASNIKPAQANQAQIKQDYIT